MNSKESHFRALSPRCGLTLIEIAVSAALVGVMLVATLNAVGAVFRTRLAARQQQEGETLAGQLMAEILQSSYKDPEGGTAFGPESDENNRSRFDDVDDYNNFSESPPKEKGGGAIPHWSGWSRQVRIQWVDPTAPSTPASSDTGLKLITVTAISPGNRQYVLCALRAAGGALEMKPPLDRTYITGVMGEVQIDGGSLSATDQIPLINHAEDN